MVVFERVLEAAEEAGVLGVVVGAHAEELGEFGEDGAFVVLDEGSVAGGAGVAAGSSVAVGVDPVGLFCGGRIWGWGFGEEARGFGRAGRHWVSLPDGCTFCGIRWCSPFGSFGVYRVYFDFLTPESER